MSKSEQEVEVKFCVRNHAAVAKRLEEQGAKLVAGRVHESNLRFDTPGGDLTRGHQVLRLRQDANAVMTYKGPALPGQEVSSRQEIEFQVSDFTAARHLLEALGYQVSVMYEKYRTTYEMGEMVVVLDEMPFGAFLEIEGPDAESIRAAADKLGLNWEARSPASYLVLFNLLKQATGLKAQHLTFEALQGLQVEPVMMGLHYAD